MRCGIGDQDYIAAFDFLALPWAWRVLERKGMKEATLSRLKRLYDDGIVIPVVNSIQGQAIHDVRNSLKQGGVGSMDWFSVAIDPLLVYLENRLSGIPVVSIPVSGPTAEGEPPVLPPLVETFKVMAYCDDVKPTISSLDEFEVADRGANLFEKSAGTKLHRDPTSNKCKFLPLGKWRRELAQEDIPTEYMRLTETLDMVGVQLCATWGQTRMKNGNILRDKVSKICGSWKAGKFMPFTARPFSANSFSLSKVWFRCHTVNIRQSDINSIHSSVKRWLYADMIIKPEEKVLFRSVKLGGLGLVHAKFKAQACFLKTFFDLSANPKYIPSLFQTTVFRAYVLKENENYPALPPYYDELFFKNIEAAKTAQLHVETMSVKQWYQFLLDQEYTELDQLDQQRRHLPSKAELLFPASG